MIKRTFYKNILLIVVLSIILAACGVNTSDVATNNLSEPQEETDMSTPTLENVAEATDVPVATPEAATPTPETIATPVATPADETAPVQQSTAATPDTTEATAPTATSLTASQTSQFGEEILFLRESSLWAFDTGAGQERQLADNVRSFAAAPDGARIALIREIDGQFDVWVIQRDGNALTQLTNNERREATLSWATDGNALVFASAETDEPYARTWPQWPQWCATSDVRVFNLTDNTETTIADGCDPAISPDGRRIVFAAPPTDTQDGIEGPNSTNSIRLVNRQGENGWNFAVAEGEVSDDLARDGLLVYGPAWSPDGSQITYHRFLGYQALVDIAITEVSGSFDGQGQPLYGGAGWLLPARVSPDNELIAITEYNYNDPRGLSGYDLWSVTVMKAEGSHEIPLPSRTLDAVGERFDTLPRAQRVAWAPSGTTLAVQLPPGWSADMPAVRPDEGGALSDTTAAGEIWRWQPGELPSERLVENVDAASPIEWLPATD